MLSKFDLKTCSRDNFSGFYDNKIRKLKFFYLDIWNNMLCSIINKFKNCCMGEKFNQHSMDVAQCYIYYPKISISFRRMMPFSLKVLYAKYTIAVCRIPPSRVPSKNTPTPTFIISSKLLKLKYSDIEIATMMLRFNYQFLNVTLKVLIFYIRRKTVVSTIQRNAI